MTTADLEKILYFLRPLTEDLRDLIRAKKVQTMLMTEQIDQLAVQIAKKATD